eukprot:gene10514-10673_t
MPMEKKSVVPSWLRAEMARRHEVVGKKTAAGAAADGSDDEDRAQAPARKAGAPGSRWGDLGDKEESSDEEDEEVARKRAEAAAAARNAAIARQLKEQLTHILLEVTDKMFGGSWPPIRAAAVGTLPCMDWLKQQCSQKNVFVLPAFETAPQQDRISAHKLAHTAAAHSKQGLQEMVEQGLVWQFALRIFKEGHECTNYPVWFNSTDSYGPVNWTKDFEPWYIADRRLMPFYDSVFRGYGWNKVTQVANVHHQG